ncbi:MAG: FMN-binding protein [Clostridiaceae bacterium]|nr:FMN-binding protein [Clostridiaceae bacterium]
MPKNKKQANGKTPVIERGPMPVLILVIICTVCVALLALTATMTADAIEAQKLEAANAGKKALFPDAVQFPEESLAQLVAAIPGASMIDLNASEFSDVKAVTRAVDREGKTIGLIIEVASSGYKGPVPVMAGIDMAGRISGIVVDASGETAGVGSPVGESSFTDQFIGLATDDTFAGIDMVSGGTISSGSVIKSVKLVSSVFNAILGFEGADDGGATREDFFPDAVDFPVESLEEAVGQIPGAVLVDLTAEDYDGFRSLTRAVDADGKTIGLLIEVAKNGYHGPVPAEVAFDLSGQILGLIVDASEETFGVGQPVGEKEYTDQFVGRPADDSFEDVDIISDATISSNSVIRSVKLASKIFSDLMTGQAEEPAEEVSELQVLFPDAEEELVEAEIDGMEAPEGTGIKFALGETSGDRAGLIVRVTGEGRNGPLPVTVGLDLSGRITGLLVDASGETPDIGQPAGEKDFTDQFIGHQVDELFDDIDVVSGATISSNAVVQAIQAASAVYRSFQEGGH